MKLWVDDIRKPTDDYYWVKTVDDAKKFIKLSEEGWFSAISIIDLGHEGGDWSKLLDWLEETGRNYHIRIHSMNPVGVENMRRIIERNGWTEVK